MKPSKYDSTSGSKISWDEAADHHKQSRTIINYLCYKLKSFSPVFDKFAC